MTRRRRVGVSILIGLVTTLVVGAMGAQLATTTVADGYARDPSEEFVPTWTVDVREHAMHRRVIYWRMQVSGQNIQMLEVDFQRRRFDLDSLPAHLKPGKLADLSIYALYGETGWPMRSMSYMIEEIWESNGPTWRRHGALVVGEHANGNPQLIPVRLLWGGFIINSLLASLVALLLMEGARLIVRVCRRRAGRCGVCNYDLTGVTGRCPECGFAHG